ncbi:hypothetical protein JQX13_46110 [Archangium violaceum]|uniref:hypothetical protein n=1 Tax=Archangium violaceum TaxID=83451 RepID=UPI00193BCF9A|nr:hypothetical protein [Archangium violaceum]QRK07337.1 hypothetical protein JQX13_46110 [Archangium violaceum]
MDDLDVRRIVARAVAHRGMDVCFRLAPLGALRTRRVDLNRHALDAHGALRRSLNGRPLQRDLPVAQQGDGSVPAAQHESVPALDDVSGRLGLDPRTRSCLRWGAPLNDGE